MSDRFEESIQQFYDKERIAATELINISSGDRVTNKDLGNNLDFCLKHLILLSRVCLKQFHKIEERQEDLVKKVESLTGEVAKLRTFSEAVQRTLQSQKPLTGPEVRKLVKEIAQQPKLVEEKALEISASLDKKLDKVEQLINHMVNWTA
uniref:ORF1 protein n=1 Tax=Cacao swollen shoot virus TaxID=31559 RepID=A0A6G8IUG4_9VIRU|nr:ORF1 protein [Cacao swollen shoot virus]